MIPAYDARMLKPTVQLCDDLEAVSRNAAQRIVRALSFKPDLLLCPASGFTPLRTYQLLAEHATHHADDFRSLRLVQLDEWGGLARDDPGSCERQIRTSVMNPLGIPDERFFGFASNAANPQAECERIQRRLASEGPIDLCVLGLGMNGHIAMNEPSSFLQAQAHIASLAESTLHHPMLADTSSKPVFGLTLGMTEILTSREILLLVSGAAKREPLRKLLGREITTHFPASLLWLHSNWTLLCDRESAEGLELGS
jgi:galactosamine-6-phosphate isomerase